ncbi:class I SAM-dependent methyltransferase [Desulfovibrio subterraneus]|uniref:Methyltransferase type 11 n=1 Tax=Desulfovibrio subterraneus TaxID=2718620 RepID=A0A7J0BEX2_9BACT|nr:class I SAM-dependent methyltransferase [Desulfovibrio subterraneus]GFM31732.1 methyltransferase type 11 [Desulfovibrio subterraneus]
MWDKDTVRRYEEWFDTQEGSFALRAEKRLLEYLVSGWPRRGHSFLEVGCGPGMILEMMYETGFDVTGLDASPAMLAAARKRMGTRADLHVGNAEHLPFGDNQFDYVALLTVLEFVEDPMRALEEAFRVAARGVIVTMLNKWSFYYLSHGIRCCGHHSGVLREATWYTPVRMRSMVRKAAGNKPFTMRSVLPGPFITWKHTLPWRFVNTLLLPYGLGSYTGIRVDLCDIETVTPLMARTKAVAPPNPIASP